MPLDLLNRWFSAAVTLLAFISIVAEAALGASASRVPQELRQKAQREGAVRVIVQLAVDATGSSPYDHESLRSWRRANIAQAQDSLRGFRSRAQQQGSGLGSSMFAGVGKADFS